MNKTSRALYMRMCVASLVHVSKDFRKNFVICRCEDRFTTFWYRMRLPTLAYTFLSSSLCFPRFFDLRLIINFFFLFFLHVLVDAMVGLRGRFLLRAVVFLRFFSCIFQSVGPF